MSATQNKTNEAKPIDRIKIETSGIRKMIRDDSELGGSALFKTAYTILKMGKFEQAEAMFVECLSEDPEDLNASLGLLCAKRGDATLFDKIMGQKELKMDGSSKEKISQIAELENVILRMGDLLAIQNIMHYIEFHGIGKVNWSEFDSERFEKLLASCTEVTTQVKFLYEYIKACLYDAENNFSKHVFKVFEQIIRYYPESEEGYVLGYVNDFIDILLKRGMFDEAIEFAKYSLAGSGHNLIYARYFLMLAALKCKNREELLRCGRFSSELKEYKELLVACHEDSAMLAEFLNLTDDKAATAQKDKEKKKAKTEKGVKIAKKAFLISMPSLSFAFSLFSLVLYILNGLLLWGAVTLAALSVTTALLMLLSAKSGKSAFNNAFSYISIAVFFICSILILFIRTDDIILGIAAFAISFGLSLVVPIVEAIKKSLMYMLYVVPTVICTFVAIIDLLVGSSSNPGAIASIILIVAITSFSGIMLLVKKYPGFSFCPVSTGIGELILLAIIISSVGVDSLLWLEFLLGIVPFFVGLIALFSSQE